MHLNNQAVMKNHSLTLLAHRGLWRSPEEKNTLAACRLALESGFGIEIDLRDRGGELVVAHDVGEPGAYPFAELAAILRDHPDADVALNVKSCGLQTLIARALEDCGIRRYFVFDMALPDMLDCIRSGLTSFTRQSEWEPEPTLYERAQGVWMDMFERDWINGADIEAHHARGKDVAIVSPELHGRPHAAFWRQLKESIAGFSGDARCYLCTDHPEKAAAFFHG